MRLIALLASALLVASCGDVHTKAQDITPTAPTSTTPGAPASLVLLASSRSDQQLDVTAQLLDANNRGVPNVDLALSITGGTVTPALAKTDASGTVKATAITSGTATLTATIGTITKAISVIGSATPLTVTLGIPSVVIGTASTLNASVSGQAIGGAFSYAWTFGDGKSDTGSTGSIVHAYPGIGTYNASVKVTDGAGRTASHAAVATVTDVPVVVVPTPTPAPAATLAVTTTCTAVASPGASSCNVNLTYGGNALSVTNVQAIDWDWGDGSNLAPDTGLPASGVVRTHAYAHPGTYLVTATVRATTSDGTKTSSGAKSITVN